MYNTNSVVYIEENALAYKLCRVFFFFFNISVVCGVCGTRDDHPPCLEQFFSLNYYKKKKKNEILILK